MTAFLTTNVLRAHAAPDFPPAGFAHSPAPARPLPARLQRPVLTARWLVAPDGRLTCRWQTDASAPSEPPPH